MLNKNVKLVDMDFLILLLPVVVVWCRTGVVVYSIHYLSVLVVPRLWYLSRTPRKCFEAWRP
jgi:hypothetical protein